MYTHNLNPILLDFGFIAIRWYSLAYIFGIIFGWLYCNKVLIKESRLKEIFSDYISYLIVGIIIGGRLGYVILYNFSYYINNPFEVLMIWNGGMSFHGALLGIIIVTTFFSKIKKVSSFYLLDLVAVVSPIGIFLGRISNFINSELFGRQTDLFWSVKFIKIDDINRHPSQLYEALFEGLILFLILNYLYKKLFTQTGLISSVFLILYSTFRFVIEFTREPDTQLGFIIFNLTMGQIISVLTFFVGLYLFRLAHDKK